MDINEFPLIELTKEALKENAISLLGNDYSSEKEKQLLDCFIENEKYITHQSFSKYKKFAESILDKFNSVLNFHGVESLYDQDNPALDNYDIYYCNSGDSYRQTIIWINCYNNYYIGDWGSLIEWLENDHYEIDDD